MESPLFRVKKTNFTANLRRSGMKNRVEHFFWMKVCGSEIGVVGILSKNIVDP